jgi:hypothetical protein
MYLLLSLLSFLILAGCAETGYQSLYIISQEKTGEEVVEDHDIR